MTIHSVKGLIWSEKQITEGKGAEELPDPLVTVCMDLPEGAGEDVTQETNQDDSTKEKTSVRFNDIFFFDCKLETEQFVKAKIQVDVYSHNLIRQNDHFGSCIFGFSRIFQQRDHSLANYTAPIKVPLSLEIQGYLEVSVVILGPESKMSPKIDEDEDMMRPCGDLNERALPPPTIRLNSASLIVNVYRGENLPLMNSGIGDRTCNGFVAVNFDGAREVTKTIPKNVAPTWNTAIRIPSGATNGLYQTTLIPQKPLFVCLHNAHQRHFG